MTYARQVYCLSLDTPWGPLSYPPAASMSSGERYLCKARYLGRRPVDGPLNDYKLTGVVSALQLEQKSRKGKCLYAAATFCLRSSLSYNRSKIFLYTIVVVKIEWRGMVEFNK